MRQLRTIAFVVAAMLVPSYCITVAVSQSTPPPETLRRIVTADRDGTQLYIGQPNQTVVDTEFRAWKGTTYNGRCVVVNARDTSLWNLLFVHGDDDALGITGDSRGTLVAHCSFPVHNWKPGYAHALVCYTAPASGPAGPIYGAAEGNAANFIRCYFGGGAVRLRDGVWSFVDCTFTISHLSAIEMIDPCKVNLIRCAFKTIPAPPGSEYWGTGVPIRLYALKNGQPSYSNLKSRIFVSGATLDGQPVTGPKLCPKAPASVWLKTPN